MSKLIIIGLIIVWAIVLLPDVVARLSRTRRSDSIGSFSSQLSSLGRANSHGRAGDNVIDLRTRTSLARPTPTRPARPQVPTAPGSVRRQAPRATSPAVRRRRQDVLIALGSVAALTLMAAVAFGRAFLWVHVLADVLLVTYLVLLAQVAAPGSASPSRNGRQRVAPTGPVGTLTSRAIDLRTGSVGHAVPAPARRIAN